MRGVRWEGRVPWLLVVAAAVAGAPLAAANLFLIGYLTGSQRRPDDNEYSRPGLSISGAISLSVEEINRDSPLRANHTLDFVVAETYGEEAESILQTATLWTRNISVYMGPQETCVHEARMAAAFNLPMLSYFCARYETSDKTYFPTFARTRPPDVQISKSVASVLLAFGWRRVAFLHSSAEDTQQKEIANIITKTLELCDIQVRFRKTWDTTYHIGYLENPFLKLVEETYMDTRIYVILGEYFEHLALMVTMEKKGLFANGEYFVVGVDIEQYDENNPRMYLRGLLKDETDEVAKVAYQSYLGVMGSPPVDFDEFSRKVNKYMEGPPFNFPNPLTSLGGMKRIRAEAAYLYDAVHIYARALNETLANGEDPYNGSVIISHLKGKTYKSAMGFYVHMDENGDAEGNYTLVARKPIPNSPGEFGLYPIGIFQHTENGSIPVLRLSSSINWIGEKPPEDEPICGFRGEKCITHTGEIAAGVAGGAFLTFIIVLLVAYRNWKYEQELDSLLWKIDFREIQVNQPVILNINGNKTFRSIHPVIRASQMSLMSSLDADFRYSNTMYTQTATYKGHIVAIKRVHKKNVDITREMKKELKIMRDLRHDNLNSFVGACVEPPNICVISEYCSRGSLRDILENEDVKLDSMFIASLVGDILQGMIFLHESPIRSHGHLHSGNCLVDSRWVLKIADFGLHEFKAEGDTKNENHDPQQCFENLLYSAPELLRDSSAPSGGTQKGDVYSFGIILYEIHGRHGPYGQIEMTAEEILKRIINGSFLGTPFRPQLELLENTGDCVRSCLRECWNENPEDRPDFKIIRHKLRPLRKGMRPNIFDNMIAMMEKYANNLEALVDEKAVQLVEEKKKTEALLYEMLPRYVAEQLKRGHRVEAESFDSVTIYFSDIVGFTTMSAESTPLEVVDFLNDLYTCFDSIIGSYDVYKVETIGDAYMVVSGLPIRNGDLHAGEIASMSLHLIDNVRRFHIRHRPQDTLMLRVGIHSGPVCAGVVGLKMPRYCLFGDTVNTASRMESHGLPLKIHCSSQCKEILEKLGGYTLEERGIVKMKGKGDVRTYWLTGEDEKRREERLRLRSQRLKFSRPDKHLTSCVPAKRSSFRKQAPPPSLVLDDLSPSHLESNRWDRGGLNIPSNGDGMVLKRSSWPRFGDALEFPSDDCGSGRRGCSTATLFFAHEPACDVPASDVTLPLLQPGNIVAIDADKADCHPSTSDEREPLLADNGNDSGIIMKITSDSLDYIDMETPV